MKVLCVILLLAISVCYGASKNRVCKCDWTFDNGHCYHFGDDATTWFEASYKCRGQNGYLVKINSKAEQTFLNNYAKIFVRTHSHARAHGFWIGGNDMKKEGKWEWEVNNSPFSYRNFFPGQPDNAGGKEHCAHLWGQNHGFRWNDNRCTANLHYICESNVYDKPACTCKA